MFNLKGYNFEEHNKETRRVWESFNKGEPSRVPMCIGTNARYFLFNSEANPQGISFREYTEDPEIMFNAQVQFDHWKRTHILADHPMGLPTEDEGWLISVDFQNFYEAVWFGCQLHYIKNNVPDTLPILHDSQKKLLFDQGLPDPMGGIMEKAKIYDQYFREKATKTRFFERPIKVAYPSGLNTDGPMTIACNLRGATQFCLDLTLDPDYAHSLLKFITEATIQRIIAWRRYYGLEEKPYKWGFADDSIALLSPKMYDEFILPYHKRLCEHLSAPEATRSIHLCGDATRHFPRIRQELNVINFDTGFPVDFSWLAKILGPDVWVNGGPHVELLRTASPEEVRAEVQRILASGVMVGKKFVLREANNLAPYTPLENIQAMYEACKCFGQYS